MPNTRQTDSYVQEWRSLWEPDLDAIGYNGATCNPTQVDPKVVHWIKENCGDKPRFVKVVPAPFVKKNFRNLQRVITLESNGEPGRKWKVSFGTVSKQPLWLQGWRVFSQENNLKPRDVVVFELVGNSRFRFTHFTADGDVTSGHENVVSTDQSTEQVHDADHERVSSDLTPGYSNSQSGQHHQQPISSSATESDHDGNWSRVTRNRVILSDTEVDEARRPSSTLGDQSHHSPARPVPITPKTEFDPATPSQKRRRLCKKGNLAKSSGEQIMQLRRGSTSSPANSTDWNFNPLAFIISSKRRPVTAAERKRAKDLAAAHSLVATSPHFMVVMSDAHVYQRFQFILPDDFVKKSGLPVTGCRITYKDCTGKAWVLRSRANVDFKVGLIRKGWGVFALEHLLEEGDVCVFELDDKEARSILVHIFRVVQITDVGGTSYHNHYELQTKASRSRKN